MRLLLLLFLAAVIVTGQESASQRAAADADAFRNDWYGKQYAALQEPPLGHLSAGAINREVYRFTWLRTFDHPIVIRVEIGNLRAQVFIKETNGAGGYNPGRLIRNTQFDLKASQIAELRKALDESRFWREPRDEKSDLIGLDGAQWIFDGCKDEDCHIVDRWSPNEKTPFRKLGEFFLSVGKLKIAKKEVY